MDARVQMKKYFYVDKKGYVFRSLARYDSDVKGSRPEKIYIGKICDDCTVPNILDQLLAKVSRLD